LRLEIRDWTKNERKSLRPLEVRLLAAVAAATVVFGVYVFFFERDLGAGLLKAMFGLSGGSTAGG
jgi:hypothetical protein